MDDGAKTKHRHTKWSIMVTIAVCVALIGGAAGVNYLILASEPTAQREAATRKTAALVETLSVQRGNYRPRLTVLGVVEPAREITLSPRVSGQIIKLEDCFVPGGLVDEGQVMLEIDPADFQRVLTVRESELRQVKAELAIEEGRQEVARQEFELLGEEIDPENRALVLREPQIESMRAQVRAAEAAVEQAKLDLDRTNVKAPFHAHILSRTANVGSQVTPGDALARLVGVDEYWVMASVPVRNVQWLGFAQGDQKGSPVSVRHTAAWEPGRVRRGSVTRLIGNVNEQTRLARVLVTVPDPLALLQDAPPLILGTIVEVQIEGRDIANVVRLDREYLRQNDTVWVMADDMLQIRAVDVAVRDEYFAYVRRGLDDGDLVVTTSLATVTEGLPLRQANPPETILSDTTDGDAP